jgi:hypothetical protein
MTLHKLAKLSNGTREHDDICVQKQNVLPAAQRNPLVGSLGKAFIVWITDQSDLTEFLPYHGGTAICGTIIHDNDLVGIRRISFRNGFEAGMEEISCIPIHNDDGKNGRGLLHLGP